MATAGDLKGAVTRTPTVVKLLQQESRKATHYDTVDSWFKKLMGTSDASPKSLADFKDDSCDVRDDEFDAPIHFLVKRKGGPELDVVKTLFKLLSCTKADVDLKDAMGRTALHIVCEQLDVRAAKVLVAFGANVNVLDGRQQTPLDVVKCVPCSEDSPTGDASQKTSGMIGWLTETEGTAKEEAMLDDHAKKTVLIELLVQVKALEGAEVQAKLPPKPTPVKPFFNIREQTTPDGTPITKHLMILDTEIDQILRAEVLPGDETEMALSLMSKMKELMKYVATGSRILVLDGGGMRGLIEIEVLSQIVQRTGRQIHELFDWIVGSSTGGVLALIMTYGKLTPDECRRLYVNMKDDVFANWDKSQGDAMALARTTQDVVGQDTTMDSLQHPCVMVAAVHKTTTQLKLKFFNNCFDDELSKYLCWKAACATTAASPYFPEFEGFVDGGYLATNPSEAALVELEEYYDARHEAFPISLVVSLGCGMFPEKELGSVSITHNLFNNALGKIENLVTLLGTALADVENDVRYSKIRCLRRHASYFRFSPPLSKEVSLGETDMDTLVDMMLATKIYILQSKEFDQLIEELYAIADNHEKTYH